MKKILILVAIVACFTGCSKEEDLACLNTDDNISIEMDKEQMEEEKKESDESISNLPKRVTVYVCGAVNNPGVYSLNGGERVNDAILLSGGAKDDAALEYMNLADYVFDGEKIYVISKDEAESLNENSKDSDLNKDLGTSYASQALDNQNRPNSSIKTNKSNSNLVNLNTATKEQLMSVPGIGESKAVKIISFRETQRFTSIEDIMLISGIKEGLFNKIKDYICV